MDETRTYGPCHAYHSVFSSRVRSGRGQKGNTNEAEHRRIIDDDTTATTFALVSTIEPGVVSAQPQPLAPQVFAPPEQAC